MKGETLVETPKLPQDQIERIKNDVQAFIRLGGFTRIARWVAGQEDEITAKKVAAYIAARIEQKLMEAWRPPTL